MKCDRCNRSLIDNSAGVEELFDVLVSGKPSRRCTDCIEKSVEAGHVVQKAPDAKRYRIRRRRPSKEAEEAEEAANEGAEGEAEGGEPDPAASGGEGQTEAAGGGEWVHKGGGYYENTVTGETRRGRPEPAAE